MDQAKDIRRAMMVARSIGEDELSNKLRRENEEPQSGTQNARMGNAPLPQTGEVQNRTGLSGSGVVLPLSVQNSSALIGLPQKIVIPKTNQVITAQPNNHIRSIASDYMKTVLNRPYEPPANYVTVNPERGAQIAKAYAEMKHEPNNPLVKASYDAMLAETMAQYHHAKKHGYNFEFWDPKTENDPYEASPRLATEDVNNNRHIFIFPTAVGFGSDEEMKSQLGQNPLLADSGERWNGQKVTLNDIFRAVHDLYGHAKEGVGFRADGEENAWRAHAAMYSPLARGALTSETRGQNSWVNFGPHGEKNKKANPVDTVYADQKIGLMPSWTMFHGAEDFTNPSLIEEINKIFKQAQIKKSDGGFVPDQEKSIKRAMMVARSLKADGGSINEMRSELLKTKMSKPKYPHSHTHEMARLNAMKTLGLHEHNTAEDRARALGFNLDEKLYHGTNSEFPAFERHPRSAETYATEDPEIANIYAESERREGNAAPNVLPIVARGKKLKVSDLNPDDPSSGGWFRENMAKATGMPKTRRMVEQLPRYGYDRLEINDMSDLGGIQTQHIFPDPSVIRSRFAAFDPNRVNENDLLAARGGTIHKADGGFVPDQEKSIKRAMMVAKLLKSDEGSLPPEEYTANLSKFMEGAHPDMFNDDGSPKTFYHGTKHDFSEFKPPVGHGGLTYVSPLPAFVNEHMGVRYYDKNQQSFVRGYGKQSRVLPVHVNVKNPFDYENPQHMQKLVDYLDKNHPYFFEYNNLENLEQGHWRSLEQPEIFNALKPLGHDSMYVGENYYDSNRSPKTVKNLAIINPKAIKSALGNRGTFDPNEADITKAVGGIADNNKSIRKAIMIAKRIHKNNGGQIGGDEIGDNTGGLSFPKEETDFRLRTKLNREQAVQSGKKPDVGLPKNERSVVRAPEGLPDFVTGNINFEDWKNRHENILTPEEAFHSANWYKNIYGNFLKYHNGDDDQSKKSMMAWLVAQQNTSPASAMQNVLLQKEQMARGVPEHLWKAGGMPNPTSAARSVLADQPITFGVGQKITDFVDSALSKKTRSYYGNDEKAGTPFVVDVHTARDTGLIDEELINHLSRLGYNQDDLNKLQVDMKTGPSAAQYENRAEFGRNLTKHLNEVNWLGKNNWTPSEVQAVGWMGMTKLTRNAEEDSESGLGRNLRRVSYELSPGEASPWQEKYGEAFETLPDDERYKITHDMAASALKHASDLAGVNVMNLVKGTGAWQKYQNPSAVSEALSTQEGADIMANSLGYLLNQTEVWHNRVKPVTSNPKGFAVDFIEHGSNNLSSQDALRDFWQKIMDADSTGLIQGYQPIQLPSGEKGIRALIDKGGKGTAEKLLETLKEGGNLDLMLNSLPYNVRSRLHEAEITKARNDWKESKNGQTYIRRLIDILGSDPSGHLNNVRSQLEKELESHLDSAYERQGRSWRKTKTKRKPSEKAVGGPVLLQNYADGGLVDRALQLAFKNTQNLGNRRP